MQLWVQTSSRNKAPGAARESLEMELPHMLGPSQREQAPSEMALAHAGDASPKASRQLLESQRELKVQVVSAP
jgi:hypothetical protein